MADDIITVTEGVGAAMKTDNVDGVHTPYKKEDAAQRADLLTALGQLGSQTTLAAILAKIIATPATEAKQDVLNLLVDGVETALTAILAKLIAAPATEAKQDTALAATVTIGTRAYGAALTRVTVAGTSAVSTAITGTEVMVHASTRCFIKSGSGTPVATTDDIPLEAGEKFHLRITSGHKIAVIQDTAGGFLNIVPVA